MNEYIEKAELIKKLCYETTEWYYSPTIKTIRDFPAADVQPVKRGRWVKCGKLEGKIVMKCSVCEQGITEMFAPKYHYCPNCGADMREPEAIKG